ncbi:MAG: amylo-alpha-1,6-glucosidase [Nanoarchaeota archaeon]
MTDVKLAYEKAKEILELCSSEHGFLASSVNKDNYKRVFSRDGVIIGLAALLTGDKNHIETFKKTLKTLADFQGEHGEIASNIDVENKKVSFGRTVGRVDATLWFVIGMGTYLKRTADNNFVKKHLSQIRKSVNLMGSWEFNQKGFIYVPQGGDWADEYINQGYVFYDELLYYKALESYLYIESKFGKKPDWVKPKIKNLRNMLNVNFWPEQKDMQSPDVYHDSLFHAILKRKESEYFVASFTPGDYVKSFDSFANSLSILLDCAEEDYVQRIMVYVDKNFSKKTNYMIPSFYPIITKKHSEWSFLQANFSFKFKNKPYHYHNGGLWPLTTGFMIAAMVKAKRKDMAKKHMEALAKFVSVDDFGFYEYFDAEKFLPRGVKFLGFSAAGYIIAYLSLYENKGVFF